MVDEMKKLKDFLTCLIIYPVLWIAQKIMGEKT